MLEGKHREMQFSSRTRVLSLYLIGCRFDMVDMFDTIDMFNVLQFITSNSITLFLGRHEFYVYIFSVRYMVRYKAKDL